MKLPSWLRHSLFSSMLLLVAWQIPLVVSQEYDDDYDATHPHAESCAWTGGSCEWDYNMQPMTAIFENDQTETFFAYVEPDVSTFYNKTQGQMRVVEPDFNGLFTKFVNMGPTPIQIYWLPVKKNQPPMYISDVQPFSASGTASYPSNDFIVVPPGDLDTVLTTFKTTKGQSLYIYDPFKGKYHKAYKKLSLDDFQKYMAQYNNNLFAKQYKEKTKRDWLALYGARKPPRYHMWPADSIGQTHTITTKEIHFVEYPPEEELAKGISLYGPRPEEITRNRKYRDVYPTMNLTLTVLSCAPRVFEIQNFLSDLEIDHLLKVASEKELAASTTKAGDTAKITTQQDSRSSTNTWIGRHQSIITDAIYRRAADLMQIDEKLFRYRRKLEIPEMTESSVGITESLQLVHYDVGQQYTPHHDFALPGLVRDQPSRFATLLLYLNDDMEGGHTSFPLWRNGETSKALEVKPEKGKAILFYNLLPDGNYDELSMHAALPVKKGEKWLANLWVWDPVLAHS